MFNKFFLLLVLVLSGFLASGCATHYGARPPLKLLKRDMPRNEVISIMGKPGDQEIKGETEGLLYSWDDPLDGGIGATEEYFILLNKGKVQQIGVLTKGSAAIFGLMKAIEQAPSKAFPEVSK